MKQNLIRKPPYCYCSLSLPVWPAWISVCHSAGRNVSCNNTSCSYDSTVAYCHPRQDNHIGTYPNIIADMNRLACFKTDISPFHIQRMSSRSKAAIGGNETVVTESDRCWVKNDKIIVCKETLTDTDITSIVTDKRLLYQQMLAGALKQLFSMAVRPSSSDGRVWL